MLIGRIKAIAGLVLLFSFIQANCQNNKSAKKITGLSFVAPPREVDSSWTKSITDINAGWVAIIPYAFTTPNIPTVTYNAERQYWGESLIGVKTNIKQAHKAGLKVMIKPQVWMRSGWIGDFDLQTEQEWKTWEKDYEQYIMTFAKLAADEKADMICIGTEYRNAIKKRPAFWSRLIADIRKTYSGKLTYCANWDDYEQVVFWKELDYIGISGYYPLSGEKEPSIADLEKAWQPVINKLGSYSKKINKQVLFTEYGYRSMDMPAWRSWEMENKQMPINLKAQAIAYEALYKTIWQQKWFAGGFAWKWYASFRRQDPINNHDWTPQNKPAQEIIKKYYK